jgi:DNA-binding NtrC family response regulator
MADVLLVDDDGSVLLTLAIALRRQGHKVTVAGDANQALSHLHRHHFEFLVSDVRMPGMSGVELAQEVRGMQEPPQIILTSAYPYVETRGGIASAFLQKPLDVKQLNELLKSSDTPPEGSPSGNGIAENRESRADNGSASSKHYQQHNASRVTQAAMGQFGFATR